ncbi:hypothetical protein O3M35_012057 [Rhynocoris fuscipes]|uniref:folate gamma-glutamyl hydrolase n=1 Tax=Rhynocoris fuscipes TaxID=488301 RepID=A0AAW1CR10_9HEMI
MIYFKFIYLFTIVYSAIRNVEGMNERPIIGVLTQEQDPPDNGSYIPASYIKAVESAGARAVPIFIDKPEEYYRDMVMSLNGIVYPGGDVNLTATTGFARAAKIIFELATELNEKGDNYPILGVCQGMQILAVFTNNDKDLLRACPGMENKALPIRFKPGYRRSSLYGTSSRKDTVILSKMNSTANHHDWCITEKNLTAFGLDKYWRVLSVNHDGAGEEFVSSMQAYKYPFVGVQFHPEKVEYEWSITQNNPHYPDAIKANRLFYDWLVMEARRNDHQFNDTLKETKSLIYNYQPVFTGDASNFSQTYIFS